MQRFSLLLIAAVALGGCASPGDRPGDDGDATGPDEPRVDAVLVVDRTSIADGPGISVADALGQAGGEGVLVNGTLFIDADGSARLCDAIAESFPPQCGGARLIVENLDPTMVPELQEQDGVRWAESVQLFGTIRAG